MSYFNKILVAGRSENSMRVIRACKELGIHTVSVYSEGDKDCMHVFAADESICIGPANATHSYLNIASIMSAATISGVDAIHPCIGFLSENGKFAEVVRDSGMVFIGPSPEHIYAMGDKIKAKTLANEVGLKLIPGAEDAVDDNDAQKIGNEIGYPLLIKATAGGGGKGIRLVNEASQLMKEIEVVRKEAKGSFGSSEIYLEKFLPSPKHIEIQVIADSHGNVVILGERECSIQRRYQKVWEETPSPSLSYKERDYLMKTSAAAIKKMGYLGVGTLEFLYQNGEFYFMEMNTRLQVEHTVTEMVTGVDLVKEQVSIAAGNKLSFEQKDIKFTGVSIECRINAEDENLVPSSGKITEYLAPCGNGVRVDSHAYSGYVVPPFYDNLLSKLITHGRDRLEAVNRMRRALDDYVIRGVSTNIPLHQRLARDEEVFEGKYDIKWLEEKLKNGYMKD